MKPVLLMALYGDIRYDGRAQRSIEALKNNYRVYLYSIGSCSDFNLENVHILHSNSNLIGRNNISRFFIYLWGLIKIIRKLNPRIIYIHDYYFSILGLALKKRAGTFTIYDAHEIIILREEEKMSIRQNFFQILEKLSIHSFDVVIAANNERAKIMSHVYCLRVQPTAIKNIPLIKEKTLESKSNIIAKYPDLEKVFSSGTSFVYQGVITRIRQLEKILDILSQTPQASLLLIGEGEEQYVDELKQHLQNSNYENVVFLGKITPTELYSVIRFCDYGIISYSMDDYNNKFCAPNKIYEYASLHLPMVTTNQQLFKQVFKEFKIGVTVSDIQLGKNNLQTDISELIAISLKAGDFQKFLDENNYYTEIKKLSLMVTTKYQSNIHQYGH